MARKKASPKSAPKALLAWLTLAAILVFLFINWPRASRPLIGETPSVPGIETTGTANSTATVSDTPERVEVITDTLNFRSKAAFEDRTILKTLTRGTVMTVKERTEGWIFA